MKPRDVSTALVPIRGLPVRRAREPSFLSAVLSYCIAENLLTESAADAFWSWLADAADALARELSQYTSPTDEELAGARSWALQMLTIELEETSWKDVAIAARRLVETEFDVLLEAGRERFDQYRSRLRVMRDSIAGIGHRLSAIAYGAGQYLDMWAEESLQQAGRKPMTDEAIQEIAHATRQAIGEITLGRILEKRFPRFFRRSLDAQYHQCIQNAAANLHLTGQLNPNIAFRDIERFCKATIRSGVGMDSVVQATLLDQLLRDLFADLPSDVRLWFLHEWWPEIVDMMVGAALGNGFTAGYCRSMRTFLPSDRGEDDTGDQLDSLATSPAGRKDWFERLAGLSRPECVRELEHQSGDVCARFMDYLEQRDRGTTEAVAILATLSNRTIALALHGAGAEEQDFGKIVNPNLPDWLRSFLSSPHCRGARKGAIRRLFRSWDPSYDPVTQRSMRE